MKTRSYVKTMEISIGGKIQTKGSLYSVRATKGGYTMCTPDMKRVRQVYLDENGNIWEHAELSRGIDLGDDGDLMPIGTSSETTTSEIKEASKSTLEKNVLSLDVYKAEEVDKYTYPSKNQGYLFKVDAGTKGGGVQHLNNYKALLAMLQTPGVALLGKCNLNNYEGLFRASLFRGNLCLQQYLYPEDINDFDVEIYDDLGSLPQKMEKVIPQLLKTFNPEEFKDVIAEQHRHLILRQEVEVDEEVEFDSIMNELMSV